MHISGNVSAGGQRLIAGWNGLWIIRFHNFHRARRTVVRLDVSGAVHAPLGSTCTVINQRGSGTRPRPRPIAADRQRILLCAQQTPWCGSVCSSAHRKGSVRRRRTMSRKPAKTQHGSTTKPRRNNAPTAARVASSTLADLQEQVSVLTLELTEARKQLAGALAEQTATSEVLRVISSSPGDLEPV